MKHNYSIISNIAKKMDALFFKKKQTKKHKFTLAYINFKMPFSTALLDLDITFFNKPYFCIYYNWNKKLFFLYCCI